MTQLDSGANAPTFDHPLEMLLACHGKILRQCRYAAEALGTSEDPRQRCTRRDWPHRASCATSIPRDNSTIRTRKRPVPGVARHCRRRVGTARRIAAAPAERACRDAGPAWDELRAVLLQIAEGMNVHLDERVSKRFIDAYTMHIAVENSELIPLAARLLTPEQLRQIGACMAARRGVGMPGTL